MTATNIDATLTERGSRYGAFGNNAAVSQSLKRIIQTGANDAKNALDQDAREALDNICTKISRIVTGDSSYPDNWEDIAGYATIMARRLRGENR